MKAPCRNQAITVWPNSPLCNFIWLHMLIEHSTTHSMLLGLQNKHHHCMAWWLYDPHPPPTYPYVKATSTYSVAVQWYARSGQLPTADGMKNKGQGDDTRCQMGCNATEDPHHVFVVCKAFNKLREDACQDMVDKTKQKIQAIGLEEAQFTNLLQTAKFLFSECHITWPLHHSFYYLGHIPKLDALID